jgi:pantothenate synthetase
MIGAALSLLGGNPLPFLKANWKIIGLIIIVVSTLGYIYYLRNTVENQALQIQLKDTEIVRLNGELKTSKENFDTITNAVKAASDESKAALKSMEELGLQIKKDNEKNALKYKTMLEKQAPKTCEEIQQHLLDYTETFKW